MHRVMAKLVKLSICPCGFSLLRDDIPLGAMYTVFPESVRNGYTFGCGGCGNVKTNQKVILTDQRAGALGYLPLEIFELDEAIADRPIFPP